MNNRTETWGEAFGEPVKRFTIENSNGTVLRLTDFGARITELRTADKNGRKDSIVLGFDTLAAYLRPEPYLGCTVGRVANRIAGGSFTLDGQEYKLFVNNGPNTLHGGKRGFDKRIWKTELRDNGEIVFRYLSPSGEENFPGAVHCAVSYRLTNDDEVSIEYLATTDMPTLVNLTNHSYFNLKGAGNGNVLDHELMIAADQFTPVDSTLIPTGELKAVKNTPMDFTNTTSIGSRITKVGGYDHNYCLRPGAVPALVLSEETSGRKLEITTSQPGVQIYTGNGLDGSLKGIGGSFEKYGAVAIETQHYPDSIHHPNFPSTILKPGQTYHHWVKYRLSCEA